MIRTAAATALAAILCAGCAGPDSPGLGSRRAEWTTVVDTVGDTVVVRTTGGTGPESMRTLVAETTIGDADGADEYMFGAISELEVATNGTIYVFDRQVPALRSYDSTGTYIRLVGQKGGGPGEYASANGLAVHRSGRIVLWDAGKASINVYTPDGEPEASWPVPGGGGFYTSGAVYADTAGNTYIRTNIADAANDGNTPQGRVFGRTGLVMWDSAGKVIDSLPPPDSPIEPAYITAQQGGGISRSVVPFSPNFAWTFSPLGYFVSARTDRYAVTLSHPAGRATRIERALEPVAVEGDERADAERVATAQMQRTDPSWRWSGTAIPSTKPWIRAILVGDDGRIWVSAAAPGERVPEGERAPPAQVQVGPVPRMPDPKWRQPLIYDVFEPQGYFLGRIAAPPRTTFRAMRGDHIWAVTRDSLDVEQVVRYRVTPGFGAQPR